MAGRMGRVLPEMGPSPDWGRSLAAGRAAAQGPALATGGLERSRGRGLARACMQAGSGPRGGSSTKDVGRHRVNCRPTDARAERGNEAARGRSIYHLLSLVMGALMHALMRGANLRRLLRLSRDGAAEQCQQ